MTEPLKGVLAMAAACLIWGLSGIYYKQLAHVPPLEVLSHRGLWSLVFFGLFLAGRKRFTEVWAALASARTLGALAIAAIMISLNWFFFIFSIQSGWAIEASLGYYIFPLVAVFLGTIILREPFNKAQATAIALAVIAVSVLAYGLGAAPWISLVLAGTFGVYGLVKRRVAVAPMPSVFVEILVLAPLAIIWLYGVHVLNWKGVVDQSGGYFGNNLHDTIMLMLSGIITAGPLILMSYASKRITLSTVGMVQYLNPSIQFLVASFVFHETVTFWHFVAFPMIWTGLAIYSWDGWRRDRSARRASTKAGTSATG